MFTSSQLCIGRFSCYDIIGNDCGRCYKLLLISMGNSDGNMYIGRESGRLHRSHFDDINLWSCLIIFQRNITRIGVIVI